MRTLQEWKAYFVKLGLGEDAANTAAQDAVKDAADAVEVENGKGISEYQKKDREMLALKNKLKDAGYVKDTHGSPEDFLKLLNDNATAGAAAGNAAKTDLEKLQQSNSELLDKFNIQEQTAREDKARAVKATITSKLTSALSGKLSAHDVHIKALLADGALKLDDSGNVVASVDGADVGFDDFTKSYLEKNKGSQIVDQKGGSGLGGNNNAGGGNEVIDLSQFEGKSVEEIQADMPAAREALGLKK